jgi:GAF domain-containing protein
LEIVNEVTQIISTKLSTRELFQTIVSQIAERLKCSHATLFLEQLEDGERLLVPQMTSGLYSEQIMQRRFRPDEGLAGWVFRQGKSLVFPDVREDPRFAGATFERDLPRSMLLAPIKVGDQTIGVISADQDQLGWFSESDRLLVEALAQQVGIAIQRSIGLELLNDIGNQIISIQEEDRILQYIVSGAIKLTNTTSGVIYLIGDDGLSVVNKYQWPHDLDLPTPRLTNREGLTYAIVTKAKTIIIPDIDEAGREHFKLWKLDARSVIGVPLKLEQKVIGVLYLHDKDPHHFTETELSLISSLANQAAIAIGNARLLEQVRKEKEERIEAI